MVRNRNHNNECVISFLYHTFMYVAVVVKLGKSEYIVYENDSQVGMRVNYSSEDCFIDIYYYFILETLQVDKECKYLCV